MVSEWTVRISPNWLLLLGSLLVVAALYNHYMGHSALIIEIALVAVGVAMAVFSLRLLDKEEPKERTGLLFSVLCKFLSKKACSAAIPLAGFSIILAWSLWKLLAVGETNLRMNDFIVTLFGLSLVLYYQVPSKYVAQKDFAVLYLMFLTIVFVVIWGSYTLITGESYARVTAYSEYYFITIPVVSLANMLGVSANAELDLDGLGLSNIIVYEYDGKLLRLGIGSGCSGLYSAGLFFSAFLAFVLIRYAKVDRPILGALGLGLLVTWVGNIVRMAITILVGSVYGHPALAFVHSYLGILIFVACIAVFWFLIVRWLDKREFGSQSPPPEEHASAAQ